MKFSPRGGRFFGREGRLRGAEFGLNAANSFAFGNATSFALVVQATTELRVTSLVRREAERGGISRPGMTVGSCGAQQAVGWPYCACQLGSQSFKTICCRFGIGGLALTSPGGIARTHASRLKRADSAAIGGRVKLNG